MMKYQDIHNADSALWKQYQSLMESGAYDEAAVVLKNAQLDNKRIDATLFNDITTELTRLQNQGKDSTWSKNVMYVGETAPADIEVDECWIQHNQALAYTIIVNNDTYISDTSNVTSVRVGDNPISAYLENEYSVTPGTVIEIVYPNGGLFGVTYKDGTAMTRTMQPGTTRTFVTSTSAIIWNNTQRNSVTIRET